MAALHTAPDLVPSRPSSVPVLVADENDVIEIFEDDDDGSKISCSGNSMNCRKSLALFSPA